MAEERSLADRLLDYGLYAPIGIALSVVEELPSLAEKGRQRAAGQIHVARVMGKLAVRQVQRRMATRQIPKPAAEQAVGPSDALPPPSRRTGSAPAAAATAGGLNGSHGAAHPPETARRAAVRSSSGAGASGAKQDKADGRPGPTVRQAADNPTAPVPPAGSLAIPGYDTLAASQVVQRLSSLRPDELDAIARYEVATRGRRTILHRIGQLRTLP
ncbi:MAG TPA: hypothetical protein VKA05_00300 [Acidimicrobiales bacterium]|nr:hypothetical protein [Acidimicrobiales bacterium]